MSTPGPQRPPSAALLAIGDEVLRGEIVNGNGARLADGLFALGAEPVEQLVVSDEPAAIRGALERLSGSHQVIVSTGGLGPTDDDRTVDVVAGMLRVGREVHQPSLETMKVRFERRGYHMTPNNIRQVEIPAGAEPLPNAVGLAPGFRVRLGAAEAFFLPGVPVEMGRIFTDHVVPRVMDLVRRSGGHIPQTRSWHVFGMGESHIDDRLSGLLEGVDDVSLHFRTAVTENHVRIVVRNREPAAAAALLDRLDQQIRSRLGAAVYGTDQETLVLTVQRTFRAARKTLALAESCTGGYAGQMVTTEPGASEFFLGSVVSYANAAKVDLLGVNPAIIEQQGAVSEACAAEMAQGAARVLRADVAVSITGVAGSAIDTEVSSRPVDNSMANSIPGNPDEKPVGTVCFAVAHEGRVHTETKMFSGDRERIRRVAAAFALDLARRAVLGIVPGPKGLDKKVYEKV